VYSINRIASIKSRQNVQLKKTKKKTPKAKATPSTNPDFKTVEKPPKKDSHELQESKENHAFEDLTNGKSRLTVTNKKSPRKIKERQLQILQEKQQDKQILNEGINK